MATLGLIAGSGRFPVLFAESARRAGHRVVAAAHVNQTSPQLAQAVDALTWVKLGEFGKGAAALREGGARETGMIGRLDLGQTVVVKGRVGVAVEALEGTDACIRRGGELARDGAVVVKAVKPGQDRRFDLPAVGPDTVDVMREARASALAVEA